MDTIYGFGIGIFALLLLIGTVVPKFLKPLLNIVRIVALIGIVGLVVYFSKNGL